MNDEMKKCPFCNSEAILETFTTAMEGVPRYRVRCSGCWCQTDWDNFSPEEAWKKWNTRYEPPMSLAQKMTAMEAGR